MCRKIFKILQTIFMIAITIVMVIAIPMLSFYARLYNRPPLFDEFKSYTTLDCMLNVYANPNINIEYCEDWCKDIENELPNNIKTIVSKYWNIIIAPEGREFQNEDVATLIDYNKTQNPYLGQEMTVYGYTNMAEKTIYICSNACGMEDLFKMVLIHEIGHSIAFQYGALDYQNEWLTIYNNNNKNNYQPHCDFASSEYSSYNPAEMFATAFSDYILKAETLKENNIDIYNYMHKLPKLKQDFNIIDKFGYSFKAIIGLLKRGDTV